jgi:hypothetical protein
MRVRTLGTVAVLVCLFLGCIPAVTAQDQGNSGDWIANTESFLIYKATAPPASQMNAQQYEQAGDQENHNPFPDYEHQSRYYAGASQKLKMEYLAADKSFDSHYFSQQELLLRKRSEALNELIQKSPGMGIERRNKFQEDRAFIENIRSQAQSRYNEAYAAEHSGQQSATSGHGCLIVTAAYGSPLAREVQLVRDYRDGTIRRSYTGSQFFIGFNAWYYIFSPAVADVIATHPLVKSVMRGCLVPLLAIVLLSQNLYALLGFSPEIATVSVLLFGAACYSLVYIFPPAFLAVWLAGRKGWNVPAPRRMKPVIVLWVLVLCGIAAGIFLSLDLLVTITSGLLVICTVLLVAGTGSLFLSGYIRKNLPGKTDRYSFSGRR